MGGCNQLLSRDSPDWCTRFSNFLLVWHRSQTQRIARARHRSQAAEAADPSMAKRWHNSVARASSLTATEASGLVSPFDPAKRVHSPHSWDRGVDLTFSTAPRPFILNIHATLGRLSFQAKTDDRIPHMPIFTITRTGIRSAELFDIRLNCTWLDYCTRTDLESSRRGTPKDT